MINQFTWILILTARQYSILAINPKSWDSGIQHASRISAIEIQRVNLKCFVLYERTVSQIKLSGLTMIHHWNLSPIRLSSQLGSWVTRKDSLKQAVDSKKICSLVKISPTVWFEVLVCGASYGIERQNPINKLPMTGFEKVLIRFNVFLPLNAH